MPFELSRRELEVVERSSEDVDLRSVIKAARTIARAENGAILHGYAAGGIKGSAGRRSMTRSRLPTTK